MHYETSAVINRPIEEVWALLTDPFNIPRFGRSALGLRKTSPGPTGVGAVWQGRMNFLGSERPVTGVVAEYDPPHTATLSLTNEGIPRSGLFRATLEVTAAGTKVVTVIEGELRGGWRLLLPRIWPIARRRAGARVRNLERLLETGRG